MLHNVLHSTLYPSLKGIVQSMNEAKRNLKLTWVVINGVVREEAGGSWRHLLGA